VDKRSREILQEFAHVVRTRKVTALRQSLGGHRAGVPLEHFKENVYFFPFGEQPRVGLMLTLNGIVQTDGRDYELAVIANEVVAVVMLVKLRNNDHFLATYQVE